MFIIDLNEKNTPRERNVKIIFRFKLNKYFEINEMFK